MVPLGDLLMPKGRESWSFPVLPRKPYLPTNKVFMFGVRCVVVPLLLIAANWTFSNIMRIVLASGLCGFLRQTTWIQGLNYLGLICLFEVVVPLGLFLMVIGFFVAWKEDKDDWN